MYFYRKDYIIPIASVNLPVAYVDWVSTQGIIMKRTKEIVIGVAILCLAIWLTSWDTHFRPDSMDCGTGMNGRGYCDDGQGFFLVPLLKWITFFVLCLIGLGKLQGHPKQSTSTEEEETPSE